MRQKMLEQQHTRIDKLRDKLTSKQHVNPIKKDPNAKGLTDPRLGISSGDNQEEEEVEEEAGDGDPEDKLRRHGEALGVQDG